MEKAKIPVVHMTTGNVMATPVVQVDENGVATWSGSGGAVILYLIATNGDTFPNDCATTYTYDKIGMNIDTITNTTPSGSIYTQTWTRNGKQLGSKSGWVKQ